MNRLGAMTLDRDQLVKLLNLTSSEYDAEALNAIRHADALLSKHGTTWADLLALPQVSAKAQQPEPTQEPQQQPTPRPESSATLKTRPIRELKVRHALSTALTILFFPYPVFVWLYEMVVPTTRRRLKPVAMLVPIFGAATAASLWVCLLLAAAQFMD
jgi:hypothetical protein